MEIFDGSIGFGTVALLILCLLVAFGFEFVNGFHDTANAVATVIYTKSLKPGVAVLWSGFMNFLGVYTGSVIGGAAVAFGIVHLLPVDVLIHIGAASGLYMVLSLLISAILWNLLTWYFGLPNSSSHALIGSILGVGLVSSWLNGHPGGGVNWSQAEKAGASLLLSPLVGFCGAGLLLIISKATIKSPVLYAEPTDDHGPPPLPIRALLWLTCTLVSFFHGSNDGQKGVGLVMLILIGIVPAHYAIDTSLQGDKLRESAAAASKIQGAVTKAAGGNEDAALTAKLSSIQATLNQADSLKQLSLDQRMALRTDIMTANTELDRFQKDAGSSLSKEDTDALKKNRASLTRVTDFVVPWVPLVTALSLGIGTTIGWKRIVVTVGEKIGKTHLTYAQGAAAELIAALTIFLADKMGLPVSTTHVLSSGVAGTMAANRSGLQVATVRNIAAAWVLTIPATACIAGALYAASTTVTPRSQQPTSAVRVVPNPVSTTPHVVAINVKRSSIAIPARH